MEFRNNPKWQIRLIAIAIFLLGFVAGALTFNAYHAWSNSHRKFSKKEDKYQKILNQLNLSKEQRAEVERIMNETREEIQALRRENEPRIREIRDRTSEKMQRVLTQEQWEKFQKLHEQAFAR
jgi:Spy/CpxP family protein refolding chaperone